MSDLPSLTPPEPETETLEMGLVRRSQSEPEERLRLTQSESQMIKALSVCMDEDFLEDFTLTKAQMKRLESALIRESKRGIQSVGTMLCKGPNCVMSHSCALNKAGITPMGLHCPIESLKMEQMRNAFAEELKIEDGSVVEFARLNDLVMTFVIENRAAAQLSSEDLLDDAVVAVTPKGDTITSRRVHPLLEIIQKMESRRASILKEFVATRETRKKFGEDDTNDKSLREAELNKRLSSLKKRLDIEAEGEEVE